jgi:hypothetical protein
MTSEFVVAKRTNMSDRWRGQIMESAVGAEYVSWQCSHFHDDPGEARACAGIELDERFNRRQRAADYDPYR